MPIRTVTVFVDEGHASRERLEAAIALAAAEEAHLDAVTLLPEPGFTYVAGAEMAADMWAQQLAEIRKAATSLADEARKAIGGAGVGAGARADTGTMPAISQIAATHARASDVSIAGVPAQDESGLASEILDGLLFESGRPVIVMPTGAPQGRIGRIVIAWDAGRASTRAIADALPLITRAEAVSLAIVDPRPSTGLWGDEPGAELAAHLARHGAKVSLDRLPTMDRSVAETLCAHAGDYGAELLVMGGYGHSKLREAILGGVTREMLQTCKLPMFMSH